LEAQAEIKRIKSNALKGCLLWILILASIPVFLFSYYFYVMEFKETELSSSLSPNQQNKIVVVEKGEPFSFGASKVRIHYGSHHKDSIISNDGSLLTAANASIDWKNNNEAIVTLRGNEQDNETIEIKF